MSRVLPGGNGMTARVGLSKFCGRADGAKVGVGDADMTPAFNAFQRSVVSPVFF